MIDRENVISNLELNIRWISDHPAHQFPGWGNAVMAMTDALELLKEQEGYVSVPFSWLVKFCTHIDFVEPLSDAEREVAWRQKLRQQFGIDPS